MIPFDEDVFLSLSRGVYLKGFHDRVQKFLQDMEVPFEYKIAPSDRFCTLHVTTWMGAADIYHSDHMIHRPQHWDLILVLFWDFGGDAEDAYLNLETSVRADFPSYNRSSPNPHLLDYVLLTKALEKLSVDYAQEIMKALVNDQ